MEKKVLKVGLKEFCASYDKALSKSKATTFAELVETKGAKLFVKIVK